MSPCLGSVDHRGPTKRWRRRREFLFSNHWLLMTGLAGKISVLQVSENINSSPMG